MSLIMFSFLLKLSSQLQWRSKIVNLVKLTSVFEELFLRETGRDKKAGVDDKRKKETIFIPL